jgi:cytochrome c biogenesis protein CcdA/thiol-disulfide isomerase/thioredoxin
VTLLLLIGFLAGVIAGVSPCILPILPIVFAGWAAPVANETHPFRARRRRSLIVMSGLVLSFGLITAVGSLVLSYLHLPQNLLRDLGLALLVLLGLSLLSPRLEQLFERPFQRFARRSGDGAKSAFFLGLGLGTVFVPCAGPVLATISVLGATHHASFYSVLLSFFFAAGAALPLFSLALIGDRFIEKNREFAKKSKRLRPIAGVLLIAMAVSIAFNLVAPLQRWIPTYTQSLQSKIENSASATRALHSLTHVPATNGNLLNCERQAGASVISQLEQCGSAPEFQGITSWLNTPNNHPLTMKEMLGKVVLIDFYTYSCINCQRSLPHVKAWYAKYHKYGLDVIGIQAPEFAFEHVLTNIKSSLKNLDIKYPVAVDNNLATWSAFSNQYWPAEYLIGPNGVIRYVAYGEGSFTTDETFIRQLLAQSHPGVRLPSPTTVANRTPTDTISPETYLGSERSLYLEGSSIISNGTATYRFPHSLTFGNYALRGKWNTQNQYIASSNGSQLELSFQANNVYLVLGGSGTVKETLNGRPVTTIRVKGYPTLYTILKQKSNLAGTLRLTFSGHVQAYDFTFG